MRHPNNRTLGEISDEVGGIIRTGPFGSQLHQSDYREDGLPVIMPKDIINGKVETNGIARIGENDELRLQEHKLKKGDIVFARRGDLGRCALIHEREDGWLCGTGSLRVSLGDTVIDPAYLYYYFNHADIISWIKNRAIGATLPNLNTSIIRNIPISYPSLHIQHKIADVLSAYDDLIEVNARCIRILEQMAQSVYREWFGKVDKKSPPDGWEEIEVKQIIERLPKGQVYEKADVGEKGEVIVIDQSRDEFLGFHNNKPDFDAHPSKPIAIFGDHTCKMQLLVRPFSIGPNVVPFTAKQGYPIHYVFTLVNGLVETREYKRHWNDLVSKKIALPPVNLADLYAKKIEPMLAIQDVLRRKNANLRRTRDLLLPRLVSGEIELELGNE